MGKYKENYAKTERDGKYCYYLLANRNQIISPEEYKLLPSEKDAKASMLESGKPETAEKQFFGRGKVLSQAEAEELYEPLTVALSDGFLYLDKLLWVRYPECDEMPVWSASTEKEDQKLAKLLLKRGQKSAAAATVVRTVVDSNDYIVVGMSLVPKIQLTVALEREHRRLMAASGKKQKLTLFRRADEA